MPNRLFKRGSMACLHCINVLWSFGWYLRKARYVLWIDLMGSMLWVCMYFSNEPNSMSLKSQSNFWRRDCVGSSTHVARVHSSGKLMHLNKSNEVSRRGCVWSQAGIELISLVELSFMRKVKKMCPFSSIRTKKNGYVTKVGTKHYKC